MVGGMLLAEGDGWLNWMKRGMLERQEIRGMV